MTKPLVDKASGCALTFTFIWLKQDHCTQSTIYTASLPRDQMLSCFKLSLRVLELAVLTCALKSRIPPYVLGSPGFVPPSTEFWPGCLAPLTASFRNPGYRSLQIALHHLTFHSTLVFSGTDWLRSKNILSSPPSSTYTK